MQRIRFKRPGIIVGIDIYYGLRNEIRTFLFPIVIFYLPTKYVLFIVMAFCRYLLFREVFFNNKKKVIILFQLRIKLILNCLCLSRVFLFAIFNVMFLLNTRPE